MGPVRLLILLALMLVPALGLRAAGSAAPLDSGQARPFIRNFPMKEYGGLNQNWAVLQGRRGLIYVGNNKGVLEYDGVRWRLLPTPGKSVVRSLALDGAGRVYVGGEGDLGVLAPEPNGSLHFQSLVDQLPPAARKFSAVWRTCATAQGVYFFTPEGVFRWDGGHFQIWKAARPLYKGYAVGDRIFTWQAETGLMELGSAGLTLVAGGERFRKVIVDLMLALPGQGILIGSRTLGLFLLEPGGIRPFKTEATDFLVKNSLYTGTLLPGGYLALATLHGDLVLLDLQGRIQAFLGKASGLQDGAANGLGVDDQGALWLALNNGISRVEWPAPLTFFDGPTQIQSSILAMHRHQGVLYLGTGRDVQAFEPAGGTFRAVEGIHGQTMELISVADQLLLGNALGVYRLEHGRAALVWPSPSQVSALAWSRRDPSRVFVGRQNGLSSIRALDPGRTRWRDEGEVPGVRERVQWIRWILEATDGSLWLSTFSQGVVHVRFPQGWQPGQASRVDAFGLAQGLPALDFIVPFRLGDELLFSTHQGIYRFDPEAGRFSPDPRFQGLFPDGPRWTYAPVTAPDGKVWMHTEDDERHLDETGYAVKGSDGAYHWEPVACRRFLGSISQCILPQEDGIVWAGGPNGLYRYDPRVPKDYHQPFPALVRKVTGKDDAIWFGGEAPAGARPPVLGPAEDRLRIEYGAPSFDLESANAFQIRLDGHDRDWSPWTAETRKDYMNLDPGRYTFRVRARNVYGTLSAEDHFTFVILPPWHHTWWAYALYALLLGGGLTLLFQGRVRALKARNLELEQKVQERTLQLAESERRAIHATEAKSEFLASMSHEIRTPMNAVLGFTHLALKTGLDLRQRDYLDKIQGAAQALLGIINDILDFSKIEAGKVELESIPFNLETVLARTADLFSGKVAEQGVALAVAPYEGPRALVGDPLRLGQVLINLVSNALKFTEAGHVDIRVETLEAGPEQALLRFEVADTGSGMTAEQQGRLFQAFSQGDASISRKHGGTGLGLTISARLVAMMGGAFSVDSEPGRGSVFAFTAAFGLQSDATGPALPEAGPVAIMARLHGARVLLVEDNAINRQVAREILASAGVIVVEAADGFAALAAAASQSCAAVLMDIQMPGMDGYEATRRLHEQVGLDLPVIAMTAHAIPGYRATCLAAGMVDYLSKPIEPEQLFRVLAQWAGPERFPLEAPAASVAPARAELDLPGIDIRLALQRLGGNRDLLCRLLARFAREQGASAAALKASLALGAWSAAEHAVHTLKGVAGNLSATQLHRAAAALERAILARQSDLWPGLLETVAIELAQVVATGVAQADLECAERPEAGPELAEPEREAMLAQLLERLRSHRPDARQPLQALQAGVRGPVWAAGLAQVAAHLGAFEFQAALGVLEKLS